MDAPTLISSAQQRLEDVLSYEGQFTQECFQDADGRMTVAQFAREIDLPSDQIFRDILRGKTKNISAKLARKIHSVKPKYRIDWLLYGTGEMIDPSAPKDRLPTPPTSPDSVTTIANLVEMLKGKDEQIRELMLALEKERERVAELEKQLFVNIKRPCTA